MNDPLANARSLDLERAVLAVLFDGRYADAPGIIQEVCPTRDYFFARDHQMIITAIYMMLSAGERIDGQRVMLALQRMSFQDYQDKKRPMAFADGIDMRDSLLAAIGTEYLGVIGQAVGAQSAFRANCQAVAEFYRQRRLIAVIAEHLDASTAVDGSKKASQIVDGLITAVTQIALPTDGTATVSGAMQKALSRAQGVQARQDNRRASWGIPALSAVMPLRPGRFIVLAASPNHGKTSLALQAAQATAEEMGPGSVGIISLEMPAEELGTVLLARDMRIPTRALDNGNLTPEQVTRADEVITRWGKTDIFLRSSHGKCTVDEVCSWVRQRHLRSGGKLALVVIDYLQLIDAKGRQTDYERFSEATRTLKRLSIDLRICLLVLSQITREGAKADRDASGRVRSNPEPRIQDLRGSGTIEQDADGIVFIWPPTECSVDTLPVFLKIGKNRGGPKPPPIEAVFERAEGQIFRQLSSTLRDGDASRAHHNHPPMPSEDAYAEVPDEFRQF